LVYVNKSFTSVFEGGNWKILEDLHDSIELSLFFNIILFG